MMHFKSMSCAAVSIVLVALVSLLPGAQSTSPYVISDDRVRSLDVTPVLGRGYSIMTNSFQSTCLMVDETTVPSFNYDYSFHDFTETTNIQTSVASSFSYSLGYWWLRGHVGSQSSSTSSTISSTRIIAASMRIERYYSSVREELSPLSADAATLLNRQDYVGFFKACGPNYVRGIRRAQEVTAFFTFTSTSTERASSYAESVQVSSWWWNQRYGSSSSQNSSFKSESSSLKIIIKGFGLGLSMEGSETFVAQNLEDYQKVMKFAFRTMTVNKDSFHIGMVYGMEVVPWVENTAFQVQSALQDEAIEIPLVRSMIPRAFNITDPEDLNFDNASDVTRALFKCKNPTYEKDKFGYCCEATVLYDQSVGEYNDDTPSERVCRPLRQLDPALIKDNMAANGEFVARLDRVVRYKLAQLSTLETCISAVRAIPERYDFNLLKAQDNVKYDGVIDIKFSVFELKMALDPFDDYTMLQHMAKELDEFLDMYIQPCYAALFGSNIGTSPDTDPTYFMAYPWHTHDACTKLSCLGNSMRWDRESEQGGCIPSMISGSDSPGFDKAAELNCKKDTSTGLLQCKHKSVPMSAHHDRTVNAWKNVVPRGRVDFFMSNFCLPDIVSEKLEVTAQQELRKNYLKHVAGLEVAMQNVALRKPTRQKNTGWGGTSDRAVDGNTDGNYWHGSTMHSASDEYNGWWEVDLADGEDVDFDLVSTVLHQRTDCCWDRTKHYTVTVWKDGAVQRTEVLSAVVGKDPVLITWPASTRGDKVRVEARGANLNVAEVEVNALITLDVQKTGRLNPNEKWYSPDWRYFLVYQNDGDLVLYESRTGRFLWRSDTGHESTGYAEFRSTGADAGTLVVVDGSDSVVGTWGTAGNTDSYVYVHNNGTMVINNSADTPIWEADTGI